MKNIESEDNSLLKKKPSLPKASKSLHKPPIIKIGTVKGISDYTYQYNIRYLINFIASNIF